MCGVFGLIRPSGVTSDDRQLFDRISSNLEHRGPNGSATIGRTSSIVGMHRLSIMDVEGGGQPFWSEDGTVGVLGNGEIYNAHELREELVARGHQFTSGSDIEVVPHLYEELGTEAFKRLRGMFALVILDERQQALLLVRDPMGEKPLSYSRTDGAIVFASEQSALVRSGAVELRLDGDVLTDYLLYGFVPEPTAIISGVSKVPAGHWLRLSLRSDDETLTRYWDPLDYLGGTPPDVPTLIRATEDAVAASCVADVPVAIALSGGLDSSVVAAIASKHRPDLHAFTIGYTGAVGSDESSGAAAFAESLGISSTTIRLNSSDVAEGFADLCSARDEPIADIAGPGYSALAKAAHDHGYPVLMNGQGGDELFWGYTWVQQRAVDRREAYRLRMDPLPHSRQALATWAATAGGLRTRRWERELVRAWAGGGRTPVPLWEAQVGYPWVYNGIRELTGRSRSSIRPRLWDAELDPQRAAGVVTDALLSTYLRVNGLAQMDRLTMRYSVEARTPLVDKELVQLVMSGRLTDDGLDRPPKASFRDIASHFVPDDVLNRPKRGFTPPVRDWLRAIGSVHQGLLADPVLASLGPFDPAALKRELQTPVKRSGQVNQMSLRLMTLELWLRGLADGAHSCKADSDV